MKKNSNEKIKQKKALQPSDGFEAVEELKAFTDTKDNSCYIKLIKTISMSSKFILWAILVEGDHFLSDEFCFFNGNYKRVRGFVTLTTSVYHPLLRSQIVLATMQCKHENNKFMEILYKLG